MGARLWAAAWCGLLSLQAAAQANPEARMPEGLAAPAPALELRAPHIRHAAELALPALGSQAKKQAEASLAPNQIGISRRAEVEAAPRIDAQSLAWRAAGDGLAAHARLVVPGAAGLRVGIRFERFPKHLELRVAQVNADGSTQVVGMVTAAQLAKLGRGRLPLEYWTPSTDGEVQLIEFWARAPLDFRQLRFTVFDVSHLLQSPWRASGVPKVLTCHVDASCVADATVQAQRAAVARMSYVKDGRSFFCTGALLNDRVSSLNPLFATAHHCISTDAAASTLETGWFFHSAACGTIPTTNTRIQGGATLLVTHPDSDFTLLRLNANPPPGALFLGWNPDPLAPGETVYGLHHPGGSFQRYMRGTFRQRERVTESETRIVFGDLLMRVDVTQGILEGGSSGSPLLTTGGQFRGTLFGGPSSNGCSNASNSGSYSDFAVYYPLVNTYLLGPSPADEHGDSAGSATRIAPTGVAAGELNRVGDVDWFRFDFPAAGDLTVRSTELAPGAATDTVGTLYGADATSVIAANDDRQPGDFNFEVSARIPGPGTYFLAVRGNQGVVGKYGLRSELAPPDDHANSAATASPLAANGSGSGFLGTRTDQDWFRITFDRAGIFEVRTTGSTDVVGRLYEADGTTLVAENDDANPPDTNFGLSIGVAAQSTLYLRVTGFDGETGAYGVVATLRSPSDNPPNYTDLWWNPAESGWGLNLNHQGDIVFGTLFTYAADGRDMWLVASSLPKQPNGTYSGPLYRARGPAFNASPWGQTPLSEVGTMTLAFEGTGRATLTYSVNGTPVAKSIERQPFAAPAPSCSFTVALREDAANYQDLWWNFNEPGWGINLAHHGDVIFATLFTYAADGRDLWLVASSLPRQADGSFSGLLHRATGPAFNASPWSPVTLAEVGTMRLAFESGIRGTLTYTFAGATVTKTIRRQVFSPPASLCR